jgi:hypothetical protein
MDPIGRAVMAGLALFVAWTVFRARSGVLYSENMASGLDENPVMFGLGDFVDAGMAVFCAAMAAGCTLTQISSFLLRR